MLARPAPTRSIPARKATSGTTVERRAMAAIQPQPSAESARSSAPVAAPATENVTAAPVHTRVARRAGSRRRPSAPAVRTYPV